MATPQISKKRKFVKDGVFKAELNEFLSRELGEDGYSGVRAQLTVTRQINDKWQVRSPGSLNIGYVSP